ncbi:hypothetical protein ABE212_02865 [Psychrobacter pacificensis]|uniref:hypothetical protein n=1 Tax=Psychrobacter pacificensis TaxID=112002 RepID=UPI003D299A63
MEIIPILSMVVSVISVFIAGLIYINSKKSVENTNAALNNAKEALKQSQDKYLYELRLNALKSTKNVEATWQNALNSVYHEKERIKDFDSDSGSTIKEMFNDYESGLLKPSFENISNFSKNLEKKFDEITEEEAKLVIRNMETMNINLKQTQEESIKRFELLYNKLKEIQP